MDLGHSISSDSLILAFAKQDSLLKDRKFYRFCVIQRESKRPRFLKAILSTRDVRFWAVSGLSKSNISGGLNVRYCEKQTFGQIGPSLASYDSSVVTCTL